MYQNNKQVGRVRINKINEGRLRKKTHVQYFSLHPQQLVTVSSNCLSSFFVENCEKRFSITVRKCNP